jgi:formylglycine-generating enzyme required for sulfatase activity
MRFAALLALGASAAFATELDTGRVQEVERRERGMVLVPGGTFSMGLDDREIPSVYRACVDELGFRRTEHMPEQCTQKLQLESEYTRGGREVYVSPFWIDRYEVTTGEYRLCVEAGSCDITPLVAGDSRFIRDDLPVVNVTWADANDFCAFRRGRLPTEAEWEKAARGDDGRRYPWGNADGDGRANVGQVVPPALRPSVQQQITGFIPLPSTISDADGFAGPAPPGSYRWGKSPYGAYDMAGNVAEWVADWFSDKGYEGLSTIDPVGPSMGKNGWRVVRGGSFTDPKFYSRTYHRRPQPANLGSISVGFRCARDIR